MPTIKKEVRSARKNYYCDNCEGFIKQGDQYLYMFGFADVGDPPRTLRYCDKCGIEEGSNESCNQT